MSRAQNNVVAWHDTAKQREAAQQWAKHEVKQLAARRVRQHQEAERAIWRSMVQNVEAAPSNSLVARAWRRLVAWF